MINSELVVAVPQYSYSASSSSHSSSVLNVRRSNKTCSTTAAVRRCIHSGGNNNIHQPGGNTSIAGSATALIDGQGNATIACQAATQTGNAGTTGNVVYTNYAPITGSTALPLDIDHLTNSVRTFAFNPAEGRLTAAEFNSSYFIQGNVGREGGQNILTRATDISSTSNGGGGGAGFVRPTHIQNGRGMAGGRGGIRILWYSNDQFAVNHPLVLQP